MPFYMKLKMLISWLHAVKLTDYTQGKLQFLSSCSTLLLCLLAVLLPSSKVKARADQIMFVVFTYTSVGCKYHSNLCEQIIILN